MDTDMMETDTLDTDTLFVDTDTLHTDSLLIDSLGYDPSIINLCNGHESLCAKRYNEVCFAITHNSHAYAPVFTEFTANQHFNIAQQLEDGIRAFNIKAYLIDDPACGPEGLYVYHGAPALGCEPLTLPLSQIEEFMDQHPSEVVSILFEGGANAQQLYTAFEEVQLNDRLFEHDLTEPWPRLGELISNNQQLVVFAGSSDSDEVNGIYNLWTARKDNEFDYQSTSEHECAAIRGNSESNLYGINSFVTVISPRPDSAAIVNEYQFLTDRVQDCRDETGLFPNYIMVDFYDLGGVLEVCQDINGL